MRLAVHDLVAEGDVVVKRYTFTGTHTGDFAGIPASGARVAVAGSELYRIRDGKVVEAVNLGDRLTFLQQIGLIPAPEPAAAP